MNGVRSAFAADLVIVDLPEGLPVPGIGSSDFVPKWNKASETIMGYAFGICRNILSDAGALIILQSKDTRSRHQLGKYVPASNMKLLKSWICINALPLTKGDFEGQEVIPLTSEFLPHFLNPTNCHISELSTWLFCTQTSDLFALALILFFS